MVVTVGNRPIMENFRAKCFLSYMKKAVVKIYQHTFTVSNNNHSLLSRQNRTVSDVVIRGNKMTGPSIMEDKFNNYHSF